MHFSGDCLRCRSWTDVARCAWVVCSLPQMCQFILKNDTMIRSFTSGLSTGYTEGWLEMGRIMAWLWCQSNFLITYPSGTFKTCGAVWVPSAPWLCLVGCYHVAVWAESFEWQLWFLWSRMNPSKVRIYYREGKSHRNWRVLDAEAGEVLQCSRPGFWVLFPAPTSGTPVTPVPGGSDTISCTPQTYCIHTESQILIS